MQATANASEGIPPSGLYAPDDVMWRVNREAALLLAGPRALLMQLAHPLVAAGVAQHSDFRRDPIRRLRATLDAMLGIIFGTPDEAREHAARVNRVHEKVHGTLACDTAAFPAGTPYDALEPSLLFWVYATLVDSARVGYECFVSELPPADWARHYEESKRMAPLLRLPVEAMPGSFEDFLRTMRETLEGPVLDVTGEARELADAVLHPPVSLVPSALGPEWQELVTLPRGVGDVANVTTLALLPPVLRERYGLPWDRKRELAWRAFRALVRRTLPLLPDAARAMPQARRAERRLARG